MTRLSQLFLPTLKDPPADAEAISHKLMVRAGLIRQLGAGLWTYLPAGWRSHRKAEQIIREEMDAIGGQEMLMPVLQPADTGSRPGRYEIDELFKLEDRKGSEMVLAMTHEETLTFHVAAEVRSYRDLPLILYHLQTKERDEPRPRAGVLRTREFTMKDAYSFDRDEEGLERSYQLHIERLRPHLRPRRPALVPGRVRRRHDGRRRAPTSTWRPARPVRTRSRWPTATRQTSRSRAPTPQPVELPAAARRARGGRHPGPDHGRGGLRRARGRAGGAAEGDAGDRRGGGRRRAWSWLWSAATTA